MITTALLEFGLFNSADNARHYPCKKKVEMATEATIEELFPGLTTKQSVLHSELSVSSGKICSLIFDGFGPEIRKALALTEGCFSSKELDVQANDVVDRILSELPTILELLNSDIEAARRGDPAASSKQEIIIAYPAVPAMAAYRLANLIHRLGVPLIPRIITEWAHSKTGIDIHPGATIGRGCFIDHGTGVVIGETVIIGSNVRFYQGVGLLARSLSADKIERLRGVKRHPTIEDNCVIYANATLIGDIIIGGNSTIGANVTLDQSVSKNWYVALAAVIKRPLIFMKAPKSEFGSATSVRTEMATTLNAYGASENDHNVPIMSHDVGW